MKKGEIRVIFSVDMFNEGVDITSVDMVLFLRPTESPIVFLQQLGRGLRRSKGEEYLNVLDFIGNYEKALKLQIEDISKNINNVDTDYLFITHSMADEEATFIYNNLPSSIKDNFKNIMITKAGCVISSHCGKHTIGILYIKKEPLLTDK